MKTNGATWKAYLDSWPKGQWFDDSDETYDGKSADECDAETIADDAVVEFTCGVIFSNEDTREGVDLVGHFRKWQRSLAWEIVVCQVPKDKQEEFKALLLSCGGKTLK